MSDEITPVEELPLEDQKKAINLQDLLYIKQYIDMNHYDKDETDAMLDSKVAEEVEADVNSKMENYYNITESDNTFYKKTDTVTNATNAVNATNAENAVNADNAGNADNADNATKINGIEITNDENGVLKVGDVIIPQKRVLYNGLLDLYLNVTDSSVTELTKDVTLPEEINDGDILEITYNVQLSDYYVVKIMMGSGERYLSNLIGDTDIFSSIKIKVNPNGLGKNIMRIRVLNPTGGTSVTFRKITKIIE